MYCGSVVLNPLDPKARYKSFRVVSQARDCQVFSLLEAGSVSLRIAANRIVKRNYVKTVVET